MRPRYQKVPCPLCSYQAFGDGDLANHIDHAHPDGIYQPGAAPAPHPAPAVEPPAAPEPPQGEPQTHQEPSPAAAPAPTGHPAPSASSGQALEVPQADPTFWVGPRLLRILLAVNAIAESGEVVNVLLTRPKGTGKTSLAREFAAAYGKPFFTVHCQLIVERDDWWGRQELSMERGTYFEKAAFLDAVETPGCVILLDEANRTHPENLNALFGFLDHRRRAYVPQLRREVAVAPGVVFFTTLNEGADYVGTNPIDEALRDRMTYAVRMGYIPQDVEAELLAKRTGVAEATAGMLVEFAQKVRRNPKLHLPVSTRQILGAASLIVKGVSIQDAVIYTVVNGMGQDVDREALLQALQMLGSIDQDWVWGDDQS